MDRRFLTGWIILTLGAETGCSPRRRDVSGGGASDVFVILGGLESSPTGSPLQAALSGCQPTAYFGTLKTPQSAVFSGVPTMVSGTTCTIELSDPPAEPVMQGTRWLAREGLRYRDTQVAISQYPDGTRTGAARRLERLYDVIVPQGSSTAKIFVTVRKPKNSGVGAKADASLSCNPMSPYFTPVDTSQFVESADTSSAKIHFVFPVSQVGSVKYSCTSLTFYEERKVVAQGRPLAPLAFEIGAEAKETDSGAVFDLVPVEELTADIEVRPNL